MSPWDMLSGTVTLALLCWAATWAAFPTSCSDEFAARLVVRPAPDDVPEPPKAAAAARAAAAGDKGEAVVLDPLG